MKIEHLTRTSISANVSLTPVIIAAVQKVLLYHAMGVMKEVTSQNSMK